MVDSAFATFGSWSIFMDERKLIDLLRHLSQLQFLQHQLWKIKTLQNKNLMCLLPDQHKATTKIELSHYLKTPSVSLASNFASSWKMLLKSLRGWEPVRTCRLFISPMGFRNPFSKKYGIVLSLNTLHTKWFLNKYT